MAPLAISKPLGIIRTKYQVSAPDSVISISISPSASLTRSKVLGTAPRATSAVSLKAAEVTSSERESVFATHSVPSLAIAI